MALSKDDLLAAARANITVVDAAHAESFLKAGATCLDVREPAEFAAGHLPGAVHVPRGVLEFMVDNHPALQKREQVLLVYCKNGGRSTLACDTLQKMGFTQVKMLAGGFDNWAGSVHKIEIDPNVYR